MYQSKQGFTVSELVLTLGLTVLIIGLSTFLINPIERVKESRDLRRQQDLQSVRQALDLALVDGQITLPGKTYEIVKGNSKTDNNWVDGTGWVSFTVPAGMQGLSKYLRELPIDPLEEQASCGYEWATDAVKYELRTCFETERFKSLYSVDSGDDSDYWEIGNDPGLDLL